MNFASSTRLRRSLRAAPIIGFAMRCREEDRRGELMLLGLNLLMGLALILLVAGYPILMTVALTAAVLAGSFILGATLE